MEAPKLIHSLILMCLAGVPTGLFKKKKKTHTQPLTGCLLPGQQLMVSAGIQLKPQPGLFFLSGTGLGSWDQPSSRLQTKWIKLLVPHRENSGRSEGIYFGPHRGRQNIILICKLLISPLLTHTGFIDNYLFYCSKEPKPAAENFCLPLLAVTVITQSQLQGHSLQRPHC